MPLTIFRTALQLLILVVATAQYAQALEVEIDVKASGFCESPDKPGRPAWASDYENKDATYSMWKPLPSVPLQQHLPKFQVRKLEWLYRHPLMLSEAQVGHATSSMGSTNRMANFCHKLMSGQAVKITLLGGSWTSGIGVENQNNSWASHFFTWIKTTFPHPDHVFINNATTGATSEFVVPCLQYFVPADADLVVLEFDVNDGWHDGFELRQMGNLPWWHDRFGSPARRAVERMLRRVTTMQNNPSVIYMHAWQGGLHDTNYYWGVEDKYKLLMGYYNLPALSMRNSLYPLLLRKPELHGQIWPNGNGDPTCFGTRIFADLIIAYLMKQCASAVLEHALPEPEDSANAISRLPPPLFSENDADATSQCFMDDRNMSHIISSVKGFEWQNEGTQKNPRWGYITYNMWDSITLQEVAPSR